MVFVHQTVRSHVSEGRNLHEVALSIYEVHGFRRSIVEAFALLPAYVPSYRRFGTACLFVLSGWKMEPVGSPETSPSNYPATVLTTPEELHSCSTSMFSMNENK
jgi:hypothetical protein